MSQAAVSLAIVLLTGQIPLAAQGVVTTVAGRAGEAGLRDGNAPEATFNRPTWLDVDPRNGHRTRTATGAGAHTTALVAPDQLYVISPAHGGILVLSDT